MKILRYTVITVLITLITALFGYRELRRYLADSLNENNLRHHVSDFIRNKFDRAVIVDAVRLESSGILTVYNMQISSDRDFNDNNVLFSAPKIELRLDLLSLIKKQIKIKNIVLTNAEFAVIKRHNSDYSSAFSFFKGIHAVFNDSGSQRADIRLENCIFNYSEQFQTETHKITLSGISGESVFFSDRIRYILTAIVESEKSSSISIKGEIFYDRSNHNFRAQNLNAKFNSVPLESVNAYLENVYSSNLAVNGSCSGELVLNSLKDSHSCTVKAGLYGFSLTEHNTESDREMLTEAEYDVSSSFDLFRKGKRLHIRNFLLEGSGTRISADGLLNKPERGSVFCAANVAGNIDLSEFSEFLQLPAGSDADGKIDFDSSAIITGGRILQYLRAGIQSDGFSYVQHATDSLPEHSFKGKIKAAVNPLSMDIAAEMTKDSSQAVIGVRSKIIKWSPFSTLTDITVTSDKFSAADLYGICALSYTWFTDQAIKDTRTGYDDILFKDKPYGKLINNNDVNMTIGFNSLTFGKNAGSGPLRVNFILDRGELTTPLFSFDAFSGKYSFFVKGTFNTDYARVSSRASMDGFDLGEWYRAEGGEGNVEGKLSASMNFDENGYGWKHFVLSNTCVFSVQGVSVSFSNTPMNRRLDRIINSDSNNIDVSSVSLDNIRFSMSQYSLSYPVHNFSASGKPFSFSSQGKYEYGAGFELPFIFKTANGQTKGYFAGTPGDMTVNYPDGRIYSLYRDYLTAPEKI